MDLTVHGGSSPPIRTMYPCSRNAARHAGAHAHDEGTSCERATAPALVEPLKGLLDLLPAAGGEGEEPWDATTYPSAWSSPFLAECWVPSSEKAGLSRSPRRSRGGHPVVGADGDFLRVAGPS